MFDSLVQQINEHLLSSGTSTVSQKQQAACFDSNKPKYKADLSLDCTVQAIKGCDHTGLISRVTYRFLAKVPATLEDVFCYTHTLNQLLVHSQIFVVKDLDGDGSYTLRMNTILEGKISREAISSFLDQITEDIKIVLTYFNHEVPIQTIQQAATSNRFQQKDRRSNSSHNHLPIKHLSRLRSSFYRCG